MIERRRYRGHEIAIELIEVLPRRFRWSWTIDRTHKSRSSGVLSTEEVALSEAFLYAQVMVARLRSPSPADAR